MCACVYVRSEVYSTMEKYSGFVQQKHTRPIMRSVNLNPADGSAICEHLQTKKKKSLKEQDCMQLSTICVLTYAEEGK